MYCIPFLPVVCSVRILDWYASTRFTGMRSVINFLQPFPPAKATFAGIAVLVGIRTLPEFIREDLCESSLNFSRSNPSLEEISRLKRAGGRKTQEIRCFLRAHIHDGSPVMQFSHFSVKEYLAPSRISEGRRRYSTPLELAHLFVTRLCLSNLLQLDKHVIGKSCKEVSLARYAGQYWADCAKFGNVPFPGCKHVWVQFPNPVAYCIPKRVVRGRAGPTQAPRRCRRWCSEIQYTLYCASLYGYHKITRLLLEHGADANCKADHGDTPLRFLLEADGSLEVAQTLLDHGADPNARSISLWISLYETLRKGHRGLAKLLLKHGADHFPADRKVCTIPPVPLS
jgi:hypothetical protein